MGSGGRDLKQKTPLTVVQSLLNVGFFFLFQHPQNSWINVSLLAPPSDYFHFTRFDKWWCEILEKECRGAETRRWLRKRARLLKPRPSRPQASVLVHYYVWVLIPMVTSRHLATTVTIRIKTRFLGTPMTLISSLMLLPWLKEQKLCYWECFARFFGDYVPAGLKFKWAEAELTTDDKRQSSGILMVH